MNTENQQENRNRNFDASKPMDSRKEVAQSNDEKIDQDFTGFPHAPTREDQIDVETGEHNTDATVEKMSASPNNSGVSERFASGDEESVQRTKNKNTDNPQREKKAAGEEPHNDETGIPQNVTTKDLENPVELRGTDIEEASRR